MNNALTRLLVMGMLALVLSGCARTIVIDDTPAPALPPAEMTPGEAGVHYLSVVCRMNNFIQEEFPASWNSEDFEVIKAMAVQGRDLSTAAAQSLDLATPAWPVAISEDVMSVSREYYDFAGYFGALAQASDPWEMLSVSYPEDNGAGASAQRIRAHLGLGADTKESCINR